MNEQRCHFEGTLSVLTTRIEESYAQEITLFGLYLNLLEGAMMHYFDGTLSVLTTRIEESYAQEITLFGLYLNLLEGAVMQRCSFKMTLK